MAQNNDNSPSTLWTRRSNTTNKPSLSMTRSDRNDSRDDLPSAKRMASFGASGKSNPFHSIGPISTSNVASPTGSGAASFSLGSGAFASFGNAGKTPKTPGATFELGKSNGEKKDSSDESGKDSKRPIMRKSQSAIRTPTSAVEAPLVSSRDSAQSWPLKYTWVIYYRPPTSKNTDYEKSIKPLFRIPTATGFWKVYSHLKRPSDLPTVSDYHIFREGIRPVWEDEENRKGGKWAMRLKKGVADRYWENLLLALIGDQFAEAGEEVCGAVVSVRQGEDVLSIWTKSGGRNVKIRETLRRILNLPADTNLQWRSHDDSITQADQVRHEKRRNTLADKEKSDDQ